jgi:hypothetical protein
LVTFPELDPVGFQGQELDQEAVQEHADL